MFSCMHNYIMYGGYIGFAVKNKVSGYIAICSVYIEGFSSYM